MTRRRPGRRWLQPGRRIDLAVVGAVIAVDVVGMTVVSMGGDAKSAPLDIRTAALSVACAAILWWRRRRPVLVLSGTVLAVGLTAALAEPGLLSQQTGLSVVVATYAVGSWSDHRRRDVVVPAVLLVLLFLGALDDGSSVAQAAAACAAVVALPWVGGYAARARRLYVEEVERRLEEAERDRDERARRAVLDERTHIARELHDVVAHHVSLIGVQAGAARTALDQSPSSIGQALLAIEEASRAAVGDMRHLLEVLRSEPDGAGRSAAPQPGLAQLDRLVEGFRAAGIDVALSVRGEAPPLPPTLELCCYRIVEEALTNVARHSAAACAGVDIDVGARSVHLVVCDPGPARAVTTGIGRGHLGMAERVALFGGRLVVGVTPAGYAVEAEIPRVPT